MMDVSIPVNQTENHLSSQNSLINWNKIITSLKSPKNIITLIVMFIICITGAALVLVLFDLIKLGITKKVFWIEIFSQILTGIFTLLTLISLHTRIIPFITALYLLIKSKNNKDFFLSTDCIKKQKMIKKYASWYNEQYDSLSFLLFVYLIWMLNILSQTSLTILMWGFSSYNPDGNIVLPMITPKPRPNTIVFSSLGIAISSSMFASALAGYKSYRRNQLQKLEKSESSINNI